MEKILELRNISMNYHELSSETKAIENVSFSVSEGEFISIVGPSGCGKSTLLSIIDNLIKPSSGEVFMKGKKHFESDLSIGYMLQKDHLFNWRTIRKNVMLGLEIKKILTKENIEYAESLLDQYGLGEFKNHTPSQLSGGMKQRAALIRTLAVKPEILLLDEPFSALDYQTRLYVCDDISTIIRKERKTAILVTHDISEAISVSDRIIVLTKRPSTVSSIHDIHLSSHEKSPMQAREMSQFKDHFNAIWKELDVHE